MGDNVSMHIAACDVRDVNTYLVRISTNGSWTFPRGRKEWQMCPCAAEAVAGC
jgi:hypothetical protein